MPEISPEEDSTHRQRHTSDTQPSLGVQRFDLLRRAALSLSAGPDLEEVLQSLLQEALTMLDAGSWSIWLMDGDGTTLTCWRAQGPAGDMLSGYRVAPDAGVETWVVSNNTSAYVRDLRSDPRHDQRIARQNQISAASLICSPLSAGPVGQGATPIGALTVVSSRIDGFTDADIGLVEALAASVAAAIRNVRLYEESQRELERRRRVEQALRESESHYRTLVETSPDSIVLLSLDGKILMCNHRTLTLHGYDRPMDVLGRSFLGLIAPEARPAAMAAFQLMLQGQTLHNQEVTMVRSDGAPFTGELSAIITADSHGEPSGIVGFARDVTDRKEAEAALRSHNLELQLLNDIATHINQSRNPQHLLETALDRTLNVMDFDTGWAALFDADTADPLHAEVAVSRGVLAKSETARRSADLLNELVDGVLRTRRPVVLRSVELFELYAGASAPCQVVAVPLVSQDRVIGILGVAGLRQRHPRTISLRHVQLLDAIGHQISAAVDNARLSLEASEAEMLRRLDQMRADLIANFSHDLRSPLGLIKMTCSTLLRDDIDLDAATQKDFLSDIIAQTDRLSRLVEGILDLGRLEAGQLVLDRIPMDLCVQARQLINEAQQQIPTHQFTLELADEPLIVLADSELIDRVLHNLLDNAVKYAPHGGRIHLRGSLKRQKVQVSISDPGIGIPEDQLSLIFERFYRVKEAATKHIGGAGLGLTTCRGIIQAHGGKIWAASVHGEGSTFTFSLPAVLDGRES